MSGNKTVCRGRKRNNVCGREWRGRKHREMKCNVLSAGRREAWKDQLTLLGTKAAAPKVVIPLPSLPKPLVGLDWQRERGKNSFRMFGNVTKAEKVNHHTPEQGWGRIKESPHKQMGTQAYTPGLVVAPQQAMAWQGWKLALRAELQKYFSSLKSTKLLLDTLLSQSSRFPKELGPPSCKSKAVHKPWGCQ